MDVIERDVGLVAIAWAQFDEHCLADGLISQAKYLALDFVADGKGVRSCAGCTKACGLELDWSISEGMIQDLSHSLCQEKIA